MYLEHFNLEHEPFSIAPDPNFLYLSDGHGEALAHLMYGFSHGGFVLITGEVGTGKTTLLRNVIRQTPPDLDVAFILNPRLTVRELLETICDELGIAYDRNRVQSVKQFIDVLTRHLLKTHRGGRSTVVIIDEAQNLSPAVLEQIRLLTNLETNEKKLLRIILLGQPELDQMLQRNELRQLAQRITARYHLGALTKDDCHAYVEHRLEYAGGRKDLFLPGAQQRLYRLSGGIPRLINIIADRALLGAYVQNEDRVSPAIVNRAAAEVLGKRRPNQLVWTAAAVLGVAMFMAWAWYYLPDDPSPQTPHKTAEQTRAPAPARQTPAPAVVRVTEQQATAKVVQPPPEKSRSRDQTTTQPVPVQIADTAQSETTQSLEPVGNAVDIVRPYANRFQTQREAYDAVFALWGYDQTLRDTEIPCDVAPRVGLQCLGQNGSWLDIDRLNLPVVLELWDESDDAFYGAITAASGSSYTLVLGGGALEVTPRDLRSNWLGRYVVLWHTPPNYRGSLQTGDRDSTVAWLRERLGDLMELAPAQGPEDQFDPSLHDAVVRFQTAEGLLTDGIVGPATWIQLADRLQSPGPSLR
ncbi:MAG: AAA family ATPase [Kiritimatiellia bacterium]|jgi:general secretion pathway protein A|nr:AAA family ATPase [Pseudomonadales bacterium]MDP6470916.1 AAA family ATPase [Pseudomonadales bacterium]MDP6825899.1 AAA family ATPase [Pseudomonadales bacterium]MDP7024561.1 AAA family ATPase [Kiritimatiellia bacterium]|tara:strand:+ start:295 stop:2040 length:1746 start_codon:yes stop_codon:yes gene_type:complete